MSKKSIANWSNGSYVHGESIKAPWTNIVKFEQYVALEKYIYIFGRKYLEQ